jgi:hypothetical protein
VPEGSIACIYTDPAQLWISNVQVLLQTGCPKPAPDFGCPDSESAPVCLSEIINQLLTLPVQKQHEPNRDAAPLIYLVPEFTQ